jgi:hypothetical protein
MKEHEVSRPQRTVVSGKREVLHLEQTIQSTGINSATQFIEYVPAGKEPGHPESRAR